jgi:hypothetical protein
LMILTLTLKSDDEVETSETQAEAQ